MNTPNPAVETIFNAARALPPESRAEYLTLACRQDAALHRQVEELLAAADEAEQLFEANPVGLTQLGNTVMDTTVRERADTKVRGPNSPPTDLRPSALDPSSHCRARRLVRPQSPFVPRARLMIPLAMHLPSSLCGSLFALATAFIGITTQAADTPAGTESAEPEFPRHHFSVFAGGVTNFDDGEADRETSLAVGVEYEYRFGRLFGAGLLFEDVFGGEREYILLAPLSLNPWKGLRLTAGPGADFRSGDTEFVFRAGVGYEFELGHGWTLAPEIAGDFTHEAKTLVFGVSVGWGF